MFWKPAKISTGNDEYRMRYAEYILKLKNLYMFYIKYILPGLVDVLGLYLRYDNIGDILLQNEHLQCSGSSAKWVVKVHRKPNISNCMAPSL